MKEEYPIRWVLRTDKLTKQTTEETGVDMFMLFSKSLQYHEDTPPELIEAHSFLLGTTTIAQAVNEGKLRVLGDVFGTLHVGNHLLVVCSGDKPRLSALLNTAIRRINAEFVPNMPLVLSIPLVPIR